jgi:HTH-type transcriptional regulator/antitoxin HipB
MSCLADMLLRTAKDIGAAIRQRRRELELDQGTLAERVGVSRQWIVEVEAGKPRAELGLVLRTLEALGLRLRAQEAAQRRPERRGKTAPPEIDIDAIVRAARKPDR